MSEGARPEWWDRLVDRAAVTKKGLRRAAELTGVDWIDLSLYLSNHQDDLELLREIAGDFHLFRAYVYRGGRPEWFDRLLAAVRETGGDLSAACERVGVSVKIPASLRRQRPDGIYSELERAMADLKQASRTEPFADLRDNFEEAVRRVSGGEPGHQAIQAAGMSVGLFMKMRRAVPEISRLWTDAVASSPSASRRDIGRAVRQYLGSTDSDRLLSELVDLLTRDMRGDAAELARVALQHIHNSVRVDDDFLM